MHTILPQFWCNTQASLRKRMATHLEFDLQLGGKEPRSQPAWHEEETLVTERR